MGNTYILVAGFCLSLFGCGDKESGEADVVVSDAGGQWEAVVFPDAGDLSKHHVVGMFSSHEKCSEAALAELGKLGHEQPGVYGCGLR